MNVKHTIGHEYTGNLPSAEFFALMAQGTFGDAVRKIESGRVHAMGPLLGHTSLLTILPRLLNAQHIVELGTGTGIGTRAFMAAVAETGGHVFSVDMVERPGKTELEGAPGVTFLIDKTVAAAKKWKGPVDIVYVDADHSAQSVFEDLEAWAKHKPKLFLVDDTMDANDPHGSPLDGVERFCQKSGWRYWNIPLATGLAILVPPVKG